MYFEYGDTEIEYLKRKDKKLGEAIDHIGHIYREVDADIFQSVVHQIIGQQISNATLATVWGRFRNMVGEVTPQAVLKYQAEELKGLGMSFRKAEYIRNFAEKVCQGELDLEELCQMDDQKVIKTLSSLRGIGVWTAEMLLIFCMQRPDVLSYGDGAILKGMQILYHHRKMDKNLFEKYRKRYSPYGSVASLYLWAIAGGALEG